MSTMSHTPHNGMMSQQFEQCVPPVCPDVSNIPVALLPYGNSAQHDSILVPPSLSNGQVLNFIFTKQCLDIPMAILYFNYILHSSPVLIQP